MKTRLFSLVSLILFTSFCCCTANKSKSKSSRSSSRSQSPSSSRPAFPPTLILNQADFLTTPEDFENDEDVCYLVKQLHRPQTVEKFYRSAAQIYADMPRAYAEIQEKPQLAAQFLDIMKRLTAASMNEPLTVTNFIFAIGKHLRPLFKTKSEPIEQIAQTLADLETDEQRKMIMIMTQFFNSFTLREIVQLQNFIKLMSLASLTADAPEVAVPPSAALKSKNSKSSKSTRNSKTSSTISVPAKTGTLDISKTSLEPYAERILVTLANAIAKMLILLDLFVTDPTVAVRSLNLIKRLWNLHLRRLSSREGIALEELDIKWRDPAMYRKSAINFSFEDWSPEAVSAESMAVLRQAAEAAQLAEEAALARRTAAAAAARDNSRRSSFWTPAIAVSSLLTLTAIFFYLRRRLSQQQKQQSEPEPEQDYESGDDIVSKLERNI